MHCKTFSKAVFDFSDFFAALQVISLGFSSRLGDTIIYQNCGISTLDIKDSLSNFSR